MRQRWMVTVEVHTDDTAAVEDVENFFDDALMAHVQGGWKDIFIGAAYAREDTADYTELEGWSD
jgi:hypothetical protein